LDESKYLYIGLDMKGRLIELLVNHNAVSIIFHAMKLRKTFENLCCRQPKPPINRRARMSPDSQSGCPRKGQRQADIIPFRKKGA
jgi:hypothetical protein